MQHNLKLVKPNKKTTRRPYQKPVLCHLGQQPTMTLLTPAEHEEATRFRTLTATRAAQKFMVRRIMHELEGVDDMSSAA